MIEQVCEQSCQANSSDSGFDSLINGCLKVEQDRNLSNNSIKELRRYLTEFSRYCKTKNLYSPDDLSPDFLRQYVEHRCRDSGPNLKKAVVWSLRKFGKFLSLTQVITYDPAKNLRHPKFNIRSELPDYLSETELRKLLEYTAKNKNARDFAIISLLATTGLRPKEVTSIKLNDINLNKFYINVRVKGGWMKKTALSTAMVNVLTNYLAARSDEENALFVNTKGKPVSVSFLQHLVKDIGKEADLSKPLTSNCLRHTFATYMYEAWVSMRDIKEFLGHDDETETTIYVHISIDTARQFIVMAVLKMYLNSRFKNVFS